MLKSYFKKWICPFTVLFFLSQSIPAYAADALSGGGTAPQGSVLVENKTANPTTPPANNPQLNSTDQSGTNPLSVPADPLRDAGTQCYARITVTKTEVNGTVTEFSQLKTAAAETAFSPIAESHANAFNDINAVYISPSLREADSLKTVLDNPLSTDGQKQTALIRLQQIETSCRSGDIYNHVSHYQAVLNSLEGELQGLQTAWGGMNLEYNRLNQDYTDAMLSFDSLENDNTLLFESMAGLPMASIFKRVVMDSLADVLNNLGGEMSQANGILNQGQASTDPGRISNFNNQLQTSAANLRLHLQKALDYYRSELVFYSGLITPEYRAAAAPLTTAYKTAMDSVTGYLDQISQVRSDLER